ncbi:MAG: bacillithiol biosynthesis deacetylase BshB1 [Bacteroidetes bacterium]|jgi:bacillithiol biosynthesis deacetylase BshB1|nr:bacillithiol biosynthesis deacetylase BshB1 [Bacteroidota bacterium]MBL0098297.1 bacillithiol biosynthesis deacetylase BshB1 [Bacteroidota bacterium]
MKIDLLAFGAHPDDVELGAGGTLAKEISLGRKVGVVDLTRGELGTRGSATSRDEEAAASAELLGLEFRTNMCFRDGFFQNDEFHQMALVAYLRHYQPEIVICNAKSDRHPDHGKGSELVSVACFLSGLSKVKSQWNGVEQEVWRPKAVYHYIQDRYLRPDFVVDISDFMEMKMKSVLSFKTQFYDPNSAEPATAISSKEFLEFLYARAIEFGRPIGAKYAEGFTVEKITGISSLFDLR